MNGPISSPHSLACALLSPADDMATNAKKTKGLIRSHSRVGTTTGKTRPVERRGRPQEPSACERCGAVFRRRVWRRGEATSHAVLARARWTVCPACNQRGAETYMGRVRAVGEAVRAHEDVIRRRVENVGARAAAAQPERRIVSTAWDGAALEVLTTSQKLAHRIVHELKKLLGGKATYAWSDDGSLFATWTPRKPAKR
jgi:NMD protein affecting ribosome stability and mRNA decay